MVARMLASDRRKALRSLTQRGFVVHVGALESLYDAHKSIGQGTFSDFLDSTVDLLSRPNGAKDGIITKELASSIGVRLQRDNSRRDGSGAASVEVIDAFSIPKWRPEAVATSHLSSTGTKIEAPKAPIIDATANAKVAMFRGRYELALSKALRNPRFKPPSTSSIAVGKKSPYFQLTGIESLSGSSEQKLVLGMLTQLEEGNWFLEDINGTIRVDLSEASITAGLHTECSFVIAEGIFIEEEGEEPIFQVSAMGTPSFESREDSMVALGKDLNLFGGHYDPSEATELLKLEEEAEHVSFMFVSDVALDNSRVMAGLRHVFRGYLEDDFIPTVIVLMGNFLSHPFGQHLDDVSMLEEKFAELGEMIKTDFARLAEECTFVVVPGPGDPGPGNLIPRPPLPSMITKRFTEALGSENVYLTTNPCRIRYLTQEIAIFRDDIMQKMVRHCSVKPDIKESGSLSEHLIKTLADQAYLSPLPISSRPVLWNYDHALWLFPMPHTIVVADRVDSYICEYEGSLGLNPGSFSTDFSFHMYIPAQKRAQQCSLDSEEILGSDHESKQQLTGREEDMEVSNPPMVGQHIESESDAEDRDDREDIPDNSSGSADKTDSHEEQLTPQDEKPITKAEVDGTEAGPDETKSPKDDSRDHERQDEDSDHDEDDIESDDDSMLVPAEGMQRLDIKALVRNSIAADESHPLPDTGSDEDG